ncbi:hypothetical protein ACLOJK_040369 [Asimina triloba]
MRTDVITAIRLDTSIAVYGFPSNERKEADTFSMRCHRAPAAVAEQVKSGKNPKPRPCPCQELTSSTVFFRINVEHLKPMEEAKNRALVHLLGQLERQDQINNIQDLINLLKPNVKDLMNAYVDLNEDKLLWVLRRPHNLQQARKANYYPSHQKDMLLLENQLPFSAIWKLMDVFKLRLIWFVTSNVPAEFPDLEDLPHEQVATLYKTN